jgi:alpha-1,6-mannosyltransferase
MKSGAHSDSALPRDTARREPRLTLAQLLALLLAAAGTAVLISTPARHHSAGLLTGFGLGTAGWLLALWLPWSSGRLRAALALSMLLRLAWLAVPPMLSDDWARYLWDGLVWAEGLNPFEHLPSEHAERHPELFGAMNSPNYYTVYPLLAQLSFRAAATWGGESVEGMLLVLRLLLLLADGLAIWLMYRLLAPGSKHRVLVYALAPLALAETAGNVHLEGLALALVLLAAWLFERYRRAEQLMHLEQPSHAGHAVRKGTLGVLGATALAAAAAVKLHPILLVLLLPGWLGWKRGIVLGSFSSMLLLLSFLPFWSSEVAANLSSSLDLYVRKFEFNAGVHNALRWVMVQLTGQTRIATTGPALAALSVVLILGYSLKHRASHAASWLQGAFWIAIIHQGLATTVHPWYLLPMLAWSVFSGFRFAALWAALVPLTYLGYSASGFAHPYGLYAVEYLAVGGVLLLELTMRRQSRVQP